MTRDRVIELLRGADPMSGNASESDGFPSMTALLDRIDERSTDMQTQERKLAAPTEGRPQRTRQRLVAAMAGGAAVLGAVVVAIALVAGGNDSASSPSTPAEVGEAMNLAVINGDWQAMRNLYADDATYTDLASTLLGGSGRSVENIPFLTNVIPQTSPYMRPDQVWPAIGPRDWDVDGDGSLTVFDVQLIATATEYAAGVTRLHTCTETDATTIVCDEVLEGFPFLSDPEEYQVTNTYTVVDGLITHRVLDYTNATGRKLDAARVIGYQEWVRANRPELESQLFAFFGSLEIRSETIETHRELIADWKAQG